MVTEPALDVTVLADWGTRSPAVAMQFTPICSVGLESRLWWNGPWIGSNCWCRSRGLLTKNTSPQSSGTVVRLPVVNHGQRRGGPLRRQQRLSGLLLDANREAA